MNYIAIGDIHGCARQLKVLLGRAELFVNRHVVFLGDYVDVGPDSRDVLSTLADFRSRVRNVTFLLGNHDYALLRYLRDADFATYAQLGGMATIRSYAFPVIGNVHVQLRHNMPEDHIHFLHSLNPFYETDLYLFSHCGYDVDHPTDRSCRSMVLATHRHLFVSPPTLDKVAVCGHYFQRTRRPHISPSVVCLDTGCGILDGPLTAMQLPDGRVFQVYPDLTWDSYYV